MPIRIQIENFGDGKSIRRQVLNEKYNYRDHIHQFAELLISLEGELEITVGSRSEIIKEGMAAMVLPYQPHKYTSSMKNKIAIFVFSPSVIPELTSDLAGLEGDRSVFRLSESTLLSFKEKMIDNDGFDIYGAKGCLYLAVFEYLAQTNMREAPKIHNMPAGIIKYVYNHLTEDITLESVAAELGYSPKYLSSCIQKLFDMNFTSVVANVRVDKARHLLRETSMSRAEICYECGFGSERSFHRQFKKIMDFSPNEYRNMRLGKIRQGEVKKFN